VAYLPQSWGSTPPVHSIKEATTACLPCRSPRGAPTGSAYRCASSFSSIGQPSPLPSLTFRHLPVDKSVTGRPLLWPIFLLYPTACSTFVEHRLHSGFSTMPPQEGNFFLRLVGGRPPTRSPLIGGYVFSLPSSGKPLSSGSYAFSRSVSRPISSPTTTGGGEEATLKQTTPITPKHKTIPRYDTRVSSLRRGKQPPCAHHKPRDAKKFFGVCYRHSCKAGARVVFP